MRIFDKKVVKPEYQHLSNAGKDSVRYPMGFSEFEIQSYLHNALRAMGFDARGEVCTQNMSSRLDLVIFREKEPILIIEVKKLYKGMPGGRKWGKKSRKSSKKQIKNYLNLLLPIVLIFGMEEAKEFMDSDFLKALTEG